MIKNSQRDTTGPVGVVQASSQGDAELDLCVQLFEAGKELSEQYHRYDGNLDWIEWLRESLPKTGLYDILAAYVQAEVRRARIDELDRAYPELRKHSGLQGEGNYYYNDRKAELAAGSGEGGKS